MVHDDGICPPRNVSQADIREAVERIKSGGVVAFPTETYYGLAVDPFNEKALARLFELKHRHTSKPVLTLIHDVDQLQCLVRTIPSPYYSLIKKFWPGPLTLVFEGLATLPPLLTGNTSTIGVRISSHPMAQLLLESVDRPITATSANISGKPPAVNASQVERQLGEDVDLIIKGGSTPGGKGSTIIGFQDEKLVLIRSGIIPFEKILKSHNY